jgi:hypothetical protein|tara:strand:+ start:91 stop:240 length:150 start_codon:yes stop_codon:yes gene_type:complete
MSTAEALEILQYHNKWRRGEHYIENPKYTPKQIGQAIDVAIKILVVYGN